MPLSVSSAFDLNARVVKVTVWGMSSLLRQVTVVQAFTVRRAGANWKSLIFNIASSVRAVPEERRVVAASAATRKAAAGERRRRTWLATCMVSPLRGFSPTTACRSPQDAADRVRNLRR
jgi:hypothetical protein